MNTLRVTCGAFVLLSSSLAAQAPKRPAPAPATAAVPSRDTTSAETDDEDRDAETRFQFGLAGGALHYAGGRSEQATGAVLRWVPVAWLAFSATPTSVRASEPAVSATVPATTRSGLTDIPLEATLSRGFGGTMSPSLAASLGVTLPVGDTASGLGSGEIGYSVSGGFGFSPGERTWVHLGAGRSLTRFSVQSAFSSGTGWGDASAGYSLTDRLSVSSGYSSDLGAVDSTLGRSTSIEGGLSAVVHGNTTLNLNASHGVGGSAPRWSVALGIGTAFPYLNHLGAHSAAEALQSAFGGGTHGIANNGNGNGATKTNPGRGRGRSVP